jgi:hypothetical protein
VFSEESNDDAAERIYFLKREVLELRDSLAPLQKPLYDLSHAAIPYVEEGTRECPRRLRPPDPDGRSRQLPTIFWPVCCRPTSRESVCGRTRTCGRSRRGPRSWPSRLRFCGHLRHELRQHAREPRWRCLPLVLLFMGFICVGLHCAFKRTGWL